MTRLTPPISNTIARRKTRFARAFTLVELLVVIAIIGVVIASVFPVLSALRTGVSESAGYNTVSVAVSAARQLATTQKNKFESLSGGTPFQGTAALFTNTGDIRLVENIPAKNPSATQFAFEDVPGRESIRLPGRLRIVGIARNQTGINGLRLMTPPFAIRFNQHGNLVFGNPTTAGGQFNVYYDGDYDNDFLGGGTSSSSLTVRPDDFDPDDPTNQEWLTDKHEVPFEEIETVVGIIVFEDDGQYDLVGGDSDNNGTDDGYIKPETRDRILENGTIIFFSRYTGSPLRTELE